MPSSSQRFEAVVAGLMRPGAYGHEVESVQRIDTHISVVLLTGEYAYKLKKPVRLPFLDFSTLERRHDLCLHEVELNRRTAPALYLGVEAITEMAGEVRMGGDGVAVEHAVKMRQFSDGARLDQVLLRGAMDHSLARQLADDIAAFHANAEVASPSSDWGTPEEVERDVNGNFDALFDSADVTHVAPSRLAVLREAQLAAVSNLADALQARRRDGHVRDCHGDLHLANIALIDNRAVAFDCIEFSEAFRWIDVMSDLGFLLMDLEHRGADELAVVILNRYLEESGDFDGLATLRLYQGYRAAVRAKVAALKLVECTECGPDNARARAQIDSYLTLAERYGVAAPSDRRPALVITCGLSGSGKSYLIEQLAQACGAIVVRSDIERRRLFDVDATDTATRYGAAATCATYGRVAACARAALEAGYAVFADAAFLRRDQRNEFAALARSGRYPFGILQATAPLETLRRRLLLRAETGNDPSEADLEVLDGQLRSSELPAGIETRVTREVDTSGAIDLPELKIWLSSLSAD